MEEDILKYSPTVMFRGTPCISLYTRNLGNASPDWMENGGPCIG